MHMGCMKFKQRGREEQAEADGTEVIEMCLRKPHAYILSISTNNPFAFFRKVLKSPNC